MVSSSSSRQLRRDALAEFGELPLDEHLEMLRTETIDDEQAQISADGCEVLVTVLRSLASPSRQATP